MKKSTLAAIVAAVVVAVAACSSTSVDSGDSPNGEGAGCSALPIAALGDADQTGPAVVVVVSPALPPEDQLVALASTIEPLVPVAEDVEVAPRLSILVAGERRNEATSTCVDGAALAPESEAPLRRERDLEQIRSTLPSVAVGEVRAASRDDGEVHGEDPIAEVVAGVDELTRLSPHGRGTLVVLAPGVATSGDCRLDGEGAGVAGPAGVTPTSVEIAPSGGVLDRCSGTLPDLDGISVVWVGVGRGHRVSTSAGQVLEEDLTSLLRSKGADSVTVSASPSVAAHVFDLGHAAPGRAS